MPFVPTPDAVDQPACYGCEMVAGNPLALGWHSLTRHGWRRFVDVLLDRNAGTDPAKFVAALLAAGAALAVAVLAVLGAAVRAVAALFT